MLKNLTHLNSLSFFLIISLFGAPHTVYASGPNEQCERLTKGRCHIN